MIEKEFPYFNWIKTTLIVLQAFALILYALALVGLLAYRLNDTLFDENDPNIQFLGKYWEMFKWQ